MVILSADKQYREVDLSTEIELEQHVVNHSKSLFGNSSIYIDAKRKLQTKALGGTIPDGFLFDFTDIDNPEFYITEVELKKHDFYTHIFPQITKFFAFFRNPQSQSQLVEKLFEIINTDTGLKKEFKKHLKEKEIFKFLKDLLETSQMILLIIDGEKEELPEIIDTYTDTWGKMLRLMILRKYQSNQDILLSVDPEFENIEYSLVTTIDQKADNTEIQYSEEFHLDGIADPIKAAYSTMKSRLLEIDKTLLFNPRKYYISIVKGKNIAFFQFRKGKIRLVVLLTEELVRKRITHHRVVSLTESVQRFWHSPSCEVIIENTENLQEVIDLLHELVTKQTAVIQDDA